MLEALEAGHARRTLSLDAPRRTDDDEDAAPGLEAIGDTDPGYDRVEAELASDTAELDEREWQVLRMRFVDELTQQEIGAPARRLADAGLADQPRGRSGSSWPRSAARTGPGPVPASSGAPRAPQRDLAG